jgi:hypothetical protein
MRLSKLYLLKLSFIFSVLVFYGCDNNNDEILPVNIIASNEGETFDGPDVAWQDFIEINKTCLLTINATASANYTGSTRNAGIVLNVKLNDEILTSDMSFEGESSSITFYASASTTVFLQPGTYNLQVEREDIATNGNYFLGVNYYAIYAEEE